MTEVILHIYDVTNSGSDKTNNTIVQINKIFKDGIGLGGIFHSAVQVYGDDEWSFGYCEQGTGVFRCPAEKNPMYTYRECIVLGKTNFSIFEVNQILMELCREWPGCSYDLLSKNCNHFCDEFCERLDVPKLPESSTWHGANPIQFKSDPYARNGSMVVIHNEDHVLIPSVTGWVNRFANAGDAASEIAGNTALRLRQAKTEFVSASKVAYRFLLGVSSNSSVAAESPGSTNRGTPRFQASWFKNLVSNGAKPSGRFRTRKPGGGRDSTAAAATRCSRSTPAAKFKAVIFKEAFSSSIVVLCTSCKPCEAIGKLFAVDHCKMLEVLFNCDICPFLPKSLNYNVRCAYIF
ncbi:hypothetical protein HYC85_013287 [Camellia sinensis]|uniref:PPPDE domain-containing protein n=1 Tax=Camellia sinensis TaxID=4442 RepID=A0A7J7H2Z0_CAMSI|nr:hypothetical protein HYC85_013287 [Camellia sinensis]